MSCKTILPTNLDEKINALDLIGCERLSDIKEAIKKIENFNNPLKIDEEFLNLMVDEYEAWNFQDFEEDLRNLILFAQKNYPKLGTVEAVKKVFDAIGVEAILKEWFEYEGEPYHFKIFVSGVKKEEDWDKGVKLLNFVKNERSFLDSVGIKKEINSEIYKANVYKTGQKTNIYLKIKALIKDLQNNYGIAKRKTLKINIGVSIPKVNIANSNNYFGGGLRVAKKNIIGVANG